MYRISGTLWQQNHQYGGKVSSHDSGDNNGLLSSISKWGVRPPTPESDPTWQSVNQPHPFAGGLAQYFQRPEVRGLYYNGQRISLSGYKFVSCRFDNCILDIPSGDFDLLNCVIDASTVVSYGGDTMKIIKLFTSKLEWAYSTWPDLVPTRNTDGSITITSGGK
jgi:hypothetical protein